MSTGACRGGLNVILLNSTLPQIHSTSTLVNFILLRTADTPKYTSKKYEELQRITQHFAQNGKHERKEQFVLIKEYRNYGESHYDNYQQCNAEGIKQIHCSSFSSLRYSE